MKKISISIFALLLNISAFAHNNYNKDVESIKKMAGCYRVTFRNAETFSMSKNYEYRGRFQSGPVLELVLLDSEKQGKISLQHLLVNGPYIIKHWRQEWVHD